MLVDYDQQNKPNADTCGLKEQLLFLLLFLLQCFILDFSSLWPVNVAVLF